MEDLQKFLDDSSRYHNHLCPRQIIGVRLGLLGMLALQLEPNCGSKRLLVIVETDGCFVDGVSATTGCTVGHRTLRIEDYGKTAATFVDTKTGRAVRVAPNLGIRERAYEFSPGETRHYFAQLQAYQLMPDEGMFTIQAVKLNTPIAQIVSRPGTRVECDVCGEEIMNEREIHENGLVLCVTCAKGGYYTVGQSALVGFTVEQVALV